MTQEKMAVIHCGFHKTASSSIQHTLGHNRQFLKEHGWLYPELLVEGKAFFNQSIPLYGYYSKRPEYFRQYWYHNQVSHLVANAKIKKKLEEIVWKHPRIIFSDEFISTLNPDELSALKTDLHKNGYIIRVIALVREPTDLVTSDIQQLVRNGLIDTIIESISPLRQLDKIQNLIDVFDTGVEFYNFERACRHDAGPAGFFFELLGLNLNPGQTVRVNEGMSLQAVRLLSRINASTPLFSDKNSLHPLRTRFDIALLTQLPGEKFQLTQEQLTKLQPTTELARNEVEQLLGDDFFPEKRTYTEPTFVWGPQQFDFIEEHFEKLDLYILLRICDFLLELEATDSLDKNRVNAFLARVRRRIDNEITINPAREKHRMHSKAITAVETIKRILRRFGIEMHK